MSLVRSTLKWTGITLLVLIAVGVIGYLANKTYMDRYVKMAVSQARGQSQQADWYDPVDKVPGAPDTPLAVATTADIKPEALAAARATMPPETAAKGCSSGTTVRYEGRVIGRGLTARS